MFSTIKLDVVFNKNKSLSKNRLFFESLFLIMRIVHKTNFAKKYQQVTKVTASKEGQLKPSICTSSQKDGHLCEIFTVGSGVQDL